MRSARLVNLGAFLGLTLGVCAASGCGNVLSLQGAPLFNVPLRINGKPIGPGIIDTGGGYELMLRDTFGLDVAGTAEVLAFGGREQVRVTEGFRYTAGGWEAEAESALVGLSVCDCNGLGYHFFRKTGAVLVLDFPSRTAAFVAVVPASGVIIPFERPPNHLLDFEAAFIRVRVATDGDETQVLGVLDTGTNVTVLRRGLVAASARADRLAVRITEERLGSTSVRARLFDTADLPDVILGTDVMREWSDRWYFSFADGGGSVTAFPEAGKPTSAAGKGGGVGSAAMPRRR